jgi:hypothetical protein
MFPKTNHNPGTTTGGRGEPLLGGPLAPLPHGKMILSLLVTNLSLVLKPQTLNKIFTKAFVSNLKNFTTIISS